MSEITYRQIIDEFGVNRQCRQAMEECGELIQAINKMLRFPKDPVKRLDLIEEITDVKIMILQLEEIYGVTWQESAAMFNYKRHRLFEKYEQERKEKTEETEEGRAEETAFGR